MSDDQRPSGEQPRTPDEQAPRPETPEGRLAHDLASVDDPWLLDRVVSGEAGDDWASVSELLNAAAGHAEPHETHGEQVAVASFLAARAAAAGSSARGGRAAGRVAAVSTLLAGKFAAVTIAGVVTLGAGGMAAAAYSGILPAPLQDVAHRTIGAPLPNQDELPPTTVPTPSETVTHPVPTTTSSTTSPRTRHSTSAPATTTSVPQQPGRPVAELCAAWRQQLLPTSAPGFLQLTQAADGASLDVFCRITTSPTQSPTSTPTTDPTPSDSASPTGDPSTPPVTASDEPSSPPMTASDQPTATTQGTVGQPTG